MRELNFGNVVKMTTLRVRNDNILVIFICVCEENVVSLQREWGEIHSVSEHCSRPSFRNLPNFNTSKDGHAVHADLVWIVVSL